MVELIKVRPGISDYIESPDWPPVEWLGMRATMTPAEILQDAIDTWSEPPTAKHRRLIDLWQRGEREMADEFLSDWVDDFAAETDGDLDADDIWGMA